MIRTNSQILAIFTALILFSASVAAQPARISGTVTDSLSGNPLLGAHVFLSGTSIGTSTDYAGRYNITRLPPGKHTIVISIIGFARISEEIILKPGETKRFSPVLKPVVYDLGELYVGNLDDRWERYLDRFINLFIGETARADSVTILNPEVLRFESKWWGRFTAEALAPLQIENRATGYKITYHLDEFKHSGTVTRWDGDSFFTALSPTDSLQKQYWSEERTDAFLGSLRHFMLSLINNDLESQSFSLYIKSRHAASFHYTDRRRRANIDRIISKADDENHYHLRFNGKLEIIYRGTGEEAYYPQWANERRGPASVQTSYLELNEKPITIDSNGEIIEPYGATRMGYMSFTRYAETLPKEYRPDFWRNQFEQSSFSSNR